VKNNNFVLIQWKRLADQLAFTRKDWNDEQIYQEVKAVSFST